MPVPYLIMQQMELDLSNRFNWNQALSILLSNQTHLLSMNPCVYIYDIDLQMYSRIMLFMFNITLTTRVILSFEMHNSAYKMKKK